MWDRLFDRWEVDKTLRLECYDATVDCCENVQISSTGSLRYYHKNALGNYTTFGEKNDRIVYKHVDEELYLHYNDFGILEVCMYFIFMYFNSHVDRHVVCRYCKTLWCVWAVSLWYEVKIVLKIYLDADASLSTFDVFEEHITYLQGIYVQVCF